MGFDPVLAEQRFGYGLSPVAELAPPNSVAEMLARLKGPDEMDQRYPIEDYDGFENRLAEAQAIWKDIRKARGTNRLDAEKKRLKLVKAEARQAYRDWAWTILMRRVWTRDGLRERLVAFWADHLTAQGKAGIMKRGTPPYIEAAIRPHVTGRFEDMLLAAVTSPLMVHYLDQERSVGPESEFGKAKKGKFGLNENLAREVLELHTLGVGGPYSQEDVRQLAELLTGLTYVPGQGRKFRAARAEPGPETVLGTRYGGGRARLADIETALRDLARHPATARHLAEKLAVHFHSDAPPADLVATLEARYLDTEGDLAAVTEALLTHPAAWDTERHNLRLPDEYISAAMRALAVPPEVYLKQQNLRRREMFIVQLFQRPLIIMGQPWQQPQGPDGWEEGDEVWLTPQGLASRMHWALKAPSALLDDLPDPRRFVETALGPTLPEPVRFAAHAAENKREGIALVLASPAFQRK